MPHWIHLYRWNHCDTGYCVSCGSGDRGHVYVQDGTPDGISETPRHRGEAGVSGTTGADVP